MSGSVGDSANIPVRGFQRSGMDEVDAEGFAQLVWLLDRQADAPPIRRLRDWTFGALDPAAGETAVDVGSGTGDEVRRLAELVGDTGRAIGVEPNARMRMVAIQRATEAGSAATFVDGDATSLPLADASVDVARSERVFQHLDAPARAAAEIARILRPGGRVCIVDSDWGTAVLHPGDPDVVRRLHASQFGAWANPYSGRHLPKLLMDAGLEVDSDIGSQALILPQDAVTVAPMVRQSTAAAVAQGVMDEVERATLLDDLSRAAEEGWAVVSVTMFAVVARKPGEPLRPS